MSDADKDLARLRSNFDLLLRAQKFGKTGYIVSDVMLGRVYWSDSLFEQRKVPRRPHFTLAEGLEFIHPDDRDGWLAKRAQAVIDRKEFEHEVRIIGGDGSIIWERGSSQPQFDAAGNFTGLLSVLEDITKERHVAASLVEQEATYRTLFNSIGDAIFLMAGNLFVDCNDAALRVFGATQEQMAGHSPVEFSPAFQPDGQSSADKAQQKIEAALRGQQQIFEWRHARHDRTEFDAEVSLSRVEGSAEGYFFGVVRDITERKQAEIALKASHDKFAGAFSSSTDAMILLKIGEVSGEGIFLDANTAASDLFGLTWGELIGKTPREANLMVDQANLLRFREAILSNGHVRGFAATLRHTDGSSRECELSASLFHAGDGDLAILAIRDVTDQLAAARKIGELNTSLEASVRQLRAIADNLPVGIGYTDLDGRIQFLNKTAERWLAITADTARGRPAGSLFPPEYLAATKPMREAFAAGIANVVQTIPMPDGVTRVVDATNIPDVDEAGVLRGHFGLTVDVTERKKAEAELKASHEKFASAFEYSTDAMWVSQVENDLLSDITVDLNRSAEVMLDLTRTAVIGKPFPVPTLPETTAQLAAYRDRILQEGSVRDFAATFTGVGGAPLETLLSGSTFLLGDKRLMLTVLRDVTERKRAEEELRASHQKFSSAFENSTDAMVVSTVGEHLGEGVVLELNRAAESMFERSRDVFIGKPLSAFREQMGAFNLSDYRAAMVSDGSVRNLAISVPRRDGTQVEALLSGSRFFIDGKQHTLTVIRDVSEARAAERKILGLNESLEASLRQIRAITNNVPVAISFQDADGRFRFVNQTMEQWFAASAAQMEGQTIHPFVSDTYLKAIEPIRARRKSGILKSEVTLPYPDGHKRTVELTFVPERDAGAGEPVGYYTLAIDMTERKAAEDQMQQSQKMQAIGKLTGGVAHDFNNLLAVIAGNLDLVAERGGDEHIARLLEPARRAAERGSTLTRSLLAFSRQQPLSPQVCDLNVLSRDMTELLRRTLPSNIGIAFVGGAGLWKCEVDAGQLQNVLLNLVVNARDAMPDGGRLTIETQNARIDRDYATSHAELLPGQYVMLAVSDTGTGMPPDVIARAFEPFYTTKGVGEGTGLGLSMVYGFAKQSGGHVAIYSEVGSGTTVKVYLPRWKGQAAPESVRAVAAPAADNSETVLVVEDDPDMRLIAVTMLRSLGYTVLESPTGAKALKVLADTPGVTLLLSDVVLAGSMNGRRLAEEARAAHPQLKVLFMSGYTEDAIVHHGRLDEGVNFIQKPFRKADLAIKVREALDGPPR